MICAKRVLRFHNAGFGVFFEPLNLLGVKLGPAFLLYQTQMVFGLHVASCGGLAIPSLGLRLVLGNASAALIEFPQDPGRVWITRVGQGVEPGKRTGEVPRRVRFEAIDPDLALRCKFRRQEDFQDYRATSQDGGGAGKTHENNRFAGPELSPCAQSDIRTRGPQEEVAGLHGKVAEVAGNGAELKRPMKHRIGP